MSTFWPTPEQLAKDWAQSAVDFGGYRYYQFFQPTDPHCTPLPRTPPPAASCGAGDRCLCPSCQSQGWYAVSPTCRFWRADCDLCSGTRSWRDPSTRTALPCDLCEAAWAEDVAFFRDALRSPRRAAEKLRQEAARHHSVAR